MTHTSTEQPEALRLAEFFESMQKSSHRWYDGTPVHEKAAAELRRLHARVQELEDLNQQLYGQLDASHFAYAELEASKAQRARMTKDEVLGLIAKLNIEHGEKGWGMCALVAEAEAAHGITQEQQG